MFNLGNKTEQLSQKDFVLILSINSYFQKF